MPYIRAIIIFIAVIFTISPAYAQKQIKVLMKSGNSQLPDIERLKDRIQKFYEGEKAKSGKIYFELTHPCLLGDMSIDQVPEIFPWGYDLLSWKIISIEEIPIPVGEGLRKPMTASARVAMDVTIHTKDGTTKKQDDRTDYWAYNNGF